MKQEAPILEINGLRSWFFTSDGIVKAVDGVDISVGRGEILGLVGESGSGKSVTMFSVMRLVGPPGRIVGGQILFDGQDVLAMTKKELLAMRGNRVTMVFQQPNSSLNPAYRAGFQIGEVYEIHDKTKRKAAEERAVDMLVKVGIPDAKRRARSYPHQLSGGMAQRVMIAMALAAGPELLIADEPTTALDVTIQAQILDLIRELQADLGMGVVLITHDLGVVAEMAERVAVMYAGQIVEEAETACPVPGAAPPVHPGPDRVGAGHRASPRPAGGDPGPGAEPDQPARGLPVRPAMPGPHPGRSHAVHRGDAGAGRGRPRATGALLPAQRRGPGRRSGGAVEEAGGLTWRSSSCAAS